MGLESLEVENIELESESDEDIENSEINDEIDKLFLKCECISEVAVIGYILHLDATKDSNPNIVLTTSNKSCVLYTFENSQLVKLQDYPIFKNSLIGCKFSNADKRLFYTGSSDGCIKLFDLRTPQKPAFEFTDTTAQGKLKSFNCFDISANDRLLAAATDRIGDDAFIVFWDTRKQTVLGGYWEGHTDDITEVKFHPENMSTLMSGSVDGLINVYDLSQTTEDNAIVNTLNTESSVDKLQWFNDNGKLCISCITHTSDMQLWDLDGCEPYQALSRSKIGEALQNYVEGVYLVSGHETWNGLLALTGASAGNRKIAKGLNIKRKTAEPSIQLVNNKQRIRDSTFDKNNEILITGGEKGLLNLWKC